MESKKNIRHNTEIPDAVYESMLKVFIRLALKKEKRGKSLNRFPKEQGIINM